MSPIILGPKNPPMLAVQLINPTAAAAAELVKNALGSAQNDGRYAMVPNATNVKTVTNSTVLCDRKNQAPSATALVNCGIAKCQRRSRVRSELHPSTSMPISPAMNGIAPTQPIRWTSVQPVNRCSIVGNQNQNA